MWTNLFSITKATSDKKTKVICEDDLITVKSANKELHFNKVLTHGNGKILSTEFLQNSNQETTNLAKAMDYNDLHEILGHANKQTIMDTAKQMNVRVNNITDTLKCTECAMAKLRIRNFGHTKNETKVLGEKISIDISGVKTVSYGGSKFWLLIIDDYTDYIWSYFLSSKNELTEKVLEFIKENESKY